MLHWRFLDDWRQSFPWREEKHYTASLSTDASGYGWGCVVHGSSRDQISGDYWNYEQRELFVSSKKMLALVHATKTLPEEIWNCKMDALADSRVVIGAWEGQGGKTSPQLMRVTKELFFAVSSRNLQLDLQYVESQKNKADAPSRRLSRSDSKLSGDVFVMVDQAFGGSTSHPFDLMALDSNAMRVKDGLPFPNLSLFPSPCSKRVNLFC